MLKAKLALLAAKNWKKIVPIVLGILFFPFLIIVLMVSMTSTVTIEDDKAALYMDISEEIGNKYDVCIDYTYLVGIDAVRYAQDFSQATDESIKELAEKFIKEDEEGTYSTKTIEEVCKELGFSETDIGLAIELASKALELLGSGYAEFTGSQSEFIESLIPGARASYEKYKVFPSVVIAQAIDESGWGKSALAQKGNNLFGIKADSRWTGAKINMKTAEYKGNKKYYINADFRKYKSFSDSVEDHGKFLSENQRYTKHGVFTAANYAEQAKAIQRAGYATDPRYAEKVIATIKAYDLTRYDAPDFSLDSPSLNELQYLPGGANIPLMLQTDPKWANKPYGSSTIKVSGCGTTSVAMVVSGLTGKTVTPVEVSDWAGPRYYVKGAGSSWSLFDGVAKKWGLKVSQISKRNPQAILNNLKKGNPIIVSMGRGDFTRTGHFIVLRGVDSNGKILVNDPNSAKRSQKSWDLSTIISQSSKKGNSPFWVFSK